ncbi:MAG: hypothetical protein V2J24_20330 [Pseudomonadales bacterium]|nr:hypothetical protein [Pseudomonadales bacterium]
MNPNIGLARLLQPRSNTATNVLFAITFVVFALIAEMAIDQQSGEIVDAGGAQDALATDAFGLASMPEFGLRALVRPYF